MRLLPAHIAQVLESGGPFIGDAKPCTRVTVEPDWWLYLSTAADDLGAWPATKSPIRWWQRFANDQIEVEIPNLTNVSWERGVDTDAGSCNIIMGNQKMDPNDAGQDAVLGNPGYYTPDRGISAEARARWGHEVNEWEGVLDSNALIRIYSGYGGDNKTLAAAIADGNLQLEMVALVDDVFINTDDRLEIRGRDMGALLIDQKIYPPVVPATRYPLEYHAFEYQQAALDISPIVRTSVQFRDGDANISYSDSSNDHWYSFNTGPGGRTAHRGTDALDGNPDTYWLSVGNSHPSRPFCTDFIEVDCGGQPINSVYLHPWAGNYTLFVCVMEDGVWHGDQIVPYDHQPLCSTQRCVDTGADTPYVMSAGVPWETPQTYMLPRVYRAQKLRLTFRNHTLTQLGPWYYRVGVREIKVRITGDVAVTESFEPVEVAMAGKPGIGVDGYLVATDGGRIYPFGDARALDRHASAPGGSANPTVGLEYRPQGDGYWLVDSAGRVIPYGAATWLGDLPGSGINRGDIRDMAATPSGGGYWILAVDGTVYAYGDAVHAGNSSPSSVSIENHPAGGYWVLRDDGLVTAFGGAPHHGSGVGTSHIRIRRTSLGDGYWLLKTAGYITNHGTTENFGDAPTNNYTDIAVTGGDDGLWVLTSTGHITPLGNAPYFGEPASGVATLRSPGNYKDLTDIVKDLLLWSGWWLYEERDDHAMPAVFGNLESTGTYAEHDLTPDFFDKKPVIDVITALKEVVGYIFMIDYAGAPHFEAPNFWSIGNWLPDGTHTDEIPELDEKKQLTGYRVGRSGKPLRGEITISSAEPTADFTDTVTTRFVPPSARKLRGIVKQGMWVNGEFTSPRLQQIMAELIALHLWFQERQGQISCVPMLQIEPNDQIRIFERRTAETYIHYVRSVSVNHDLEGEGRYEMQITTNWLGDHTRWAVTTEELAADGGRFVISESLADWVQSATRGGSSREGTVFRPVEQYTFKALPDYTVPADGGADG